MKSGTKFIFSIAYLEKQLYVNTEWRNKIKLLSSHLPSLVLHIAKLLLKHSIYYLQYR